MEDSLFRKTEHRKGGGAAGPGGRDQNQNMEILEQLGIDGRLLLWQVINFAVLFVILKKFAWGPIVKALAARATRVEQGIKDSAEADARLKNAAAEEARIIAEAHTKASKLIADAEAAAAGHRADLAAKAKLEAERIVSDARAAAVHERDSLLAQAKDELGDLVLLSTERVLKNIAPDIKLDAAVERILKQ